jgi:hypothetical protein
MTPRAGAGPLTNDSGEMEREVEWELEWQVEQEVEREVERDPASSRPSALLVICC